MYAIYTYQRIYMSINVFTSWLRVLDVQKMRHTHTHYYIACTWRIHIFLTCLRLEVYSWIYIAYEIL